ncbi:helix-turn-helix transcriptional regulator [Spirosoma areae]
MDNTPLTFAQLPAFVADLGRKVDDLKAAVLSQNERSHPAPDRWLSIKELSQYLPGQLAVTTLYGRVQRREIPFKRMGKRLVFLQSEIDQWLKDQHIKTFTELSTVAEGYVNHKKPSERRKEGRNRV